MTTDLRPVGTLPRRSDAVRAVGLAVGLRVLGVLVLLIAATSAGDAHTRLTRWDANWYAGVAGNGYGFTRLLADGRRLSDEAFFPLYPTLERVGHALTGLSYENSGLLVSAVALVFAAWGIYAVGAVVTESRAAVVLTGVWAALPPAIVLTMAYSEAVFVALAAWSLHAVLRRRWLVAALLAALAGLTRPVGVAVAAAVIITVLVGFVQARRRKQPPPVSAVTMIATIVLAASGWLAYVGWVGWRHHDPLRYFAVQDGWGNGFDGGRAFAAWIGRHVTDVSHPGQVAAGLGLFVGVVLVLALFVVSIRDRQPLPLLVYSGVLLVFALTTTRYFGSKPRYLLPAFPLLLPIAERAVRLWRRRPTLVSLVAAPLVVAASVGGAFTILGAGPP